MSAGLDPAERDRLAALYTQRVADHEATAPGYAAAWAGLSRALLAHGGDLVVPPLEPEPRTAELAAAARVWDGAGARLALAAPNQCHGNSAALWLTEHARDVATGYALTDDGLWRQHTWALDADGTVVETTAARTRYAGVVLSPAQTAAFAADNLPAEIVEKALLLGGRFTALVRALLAEADPLG